MKTTRTRTRTQTRSRTALRGERKIHAELEFTRDLTTNLAATEPTGRTEPWRLSVLTFQTKLLRGPPWPAKVMSSRVASSPKNIKPCGSSVFGPHFVSLATRTRQWEFVCGHEQLCRWLCANLAADFGIACGFGRVCQLRQVATGACSRATVSVRSHHCCRRPGTNCQPNVKPSCRSLLVSPQFALHHVVSCRARMPACRLMWRVICLRFLFTFQATSPPAPPPCLCHFSSQSVGLESRATSLHKYAVKLLKGFRLFVKCGGCI